jgi:hypothetical protein
METFEILLIKIDSRTKNAAAVQSLLTEFGCSIKVRLGLHEAGNVCASNGLIILQLTGEEKTLAEFADRLSMIDGVTAKRVSI